jgi:hypothetical protein
MGYERGEKGFYVNQNLKLVALSVAKSVLKTSAVIISVLITIGEVSNMFECD